jgi:ribonuclease VapC
MSWSRSTGKKYRMTAPFVLDAWAMLALLQREEPAASKVKQIFRDAESGRAHLFLSIINLGEIYYRVGRVKSRREADRTIEDIRRLPLTILPATDEMVLSAAALKIEFPISYADAFAAAASRKLGGILVTGDPEMTQLRKIIRIKKLHRHNH